MVPAGCPAAVARALAEEPTARQAMQRLLEEGAAGMTSQQIAEEEERLGAVVSANGSADRLQRPLIREGGHMREASWAEASWAEVEADIFSEPFLLTR